jgi:DHA2 family multidrug resistance protein
VDYWGIGMLAVGIGALQVVLDKGQEEDWFAAHWIAALAVVSAVALLVFVIYELRLRHPIVHLRVLKERTYAAGVLMMTVVGFVLYGSMVLLPIFLQTLLGYPAIDAGIAMAPRGLGSFFAMPLVGMILMRFDPRKLLVCGLGGAALTLLQLSRLNLNAGYWDIFWPQLFQGMSMALLFVPLTTVTMDPIPKEEMGNATSVFNLMRNIGGSMGIAAATTFLERRQQVHINVLGSHVDAYSPAARQMLESARAALMARGADAATASRQAYAAVFGTVQRQAAMLAFNETFHVLALLFLAAMLLLLFMKKPAHYGGGAPAH